MDRNELSTLSPERLRELINEAVTKIRDLRFTVSTRQQMHVRDLRKAKRELARLKTVLAQKEQKGTEHQSS